MNSLKNTRVAFSIASLSVASALFVVSPLARASAVNAHSFQPAANPSYSFTEDAILNSAWNSGTRANSKVFFSAFYDYVDAPLVELNAKRTERRSTLVESMNSLSLTFGYSVIANGQIGASTSMSMVRFPDGRDQFGLGDSRFFGKVRMNSDTAPVVFALMPEIYAPTGNRTLFLSNDSMGAGMRLIAEHDFGPVQVAGNAGYRYSPNAMYRDLDARQAVPLSLGMIVPVGPRWAINADATGEISMPLNSEFNPSAFYAGLRYRLPEDFMISMGAAAGSLNGYASADFRVIAGITLMPSESPAPIVQAPAPMPPAPKPVVVSAVAKPRVIFTPKELVINEEVKFEHAKAKLTASGRNLLDEVARVLKENKANYKLIVIEGHTNELGTYAFNQTLSEHRAASVREYLANRGIAVKSLFTVGYGKTKLKKIKGLTKDALLETNRRVAFKVVQ